MAEDLDKIAEEMANGVKASVKFYKLPHDQQVAVVRNALDKQVGNDPGALIPSIPGVPLSPGIVEALTDPLLDKLAELVVGWLTKEA